MQEKGECTCFRGVTSFNAASRHLGWARPAPCRQVVVAVDDLSAASHATNCTSEPVAGQRFYRRRYSPENCAVGFVPCFLRSVISRIVEFHDAVAIVIRGGPGRSGCPRPWLNHLVARVDPSGRCPRLHSTTRPIAVKFKQNPPQCATDASWYLPGGCWDSTL
jgi:hypothetical protein